MKGLGRKLHLANPRLCDFSVSKELYDFRTPSPAPDLSNLRKPLQVDWETAKQLFVANPEPGTITLDLEKARELFVPNMPAFDYEADEEEEEPYEDEEDWDDAWDEDDDGVGI